MNIFKGLVLLVLLVSSSYGARASITKEYIMMKLCIKDKDDIFTDYIEARDNCACAINNLPNYIIGRINRKEGGDGIWRTMKEELNHNYENCEG